MKRRVDTMQTKPINQLDKGKTELLEVKKASNLADIHYIRQKEPKGLGHAVWCRRNFIGNEPFAVLAWRRYC